MCRRPAFRGKSTEMATQNKKREKIWNTLFDESEEALCAVAEISKENGLNPITAKLLYNRGYKTPADVKKFFNNETNTLYDPFALIDMEKAVARIKRAVDGGEKILIYGDYDVDGVTAVSSLYLYLRNLGADVGYYIPSRDGEGYGVSNAAVERFAAEKVNLIITVDTGITACDEAELAASLGVDMVITDHHECRDTLPRACAVVNPHRHDCGYPFKELAGVGVVFKLLLAYEIKLCEENGTDKTGGIRRVFKEYADLAAIGTIADVMPIIDENRLIVMYGLDKIAVTGRKGLSALIDASLGTSGDAQPSHAAGQEPSRRRKITSSYIGYGIAPRINAAGRISTASKAVELFLTDSDEKAAQLAAELCEINRERQVEENRIAEQAYKKIEQEFDPENTGVIVLDDDNWQQGIIGIVSSRITEKYGLPSILISFDGSTRGYPEGDDIGKGSGRSIKGLNLVDALNYCSDCLVKYGGHELAAGLTVERSKLDEFKRKINEYARKNISEEMMNVKLDADCVIGIEDITIRNVTEISTRLEPFGTANPTPSFILKDAKIEKIYAIGAGKHTKLLVSKNGVSVSAMYFGISPQKTELSVGDRVDVFFNMDINEFRGVRSVQMIVRDIKLSDSYKEELKNGLFRYEYIKGGGLYDDPQNVVPTRDDFAAVYNVLRRESRLGHDTVSERILLSMLEGKVNYIKMKFIMSTFRELNVCRVEELDGGYYHFEIYFSTGKTNLEKSYILKKLRSQAKAEV